jgi:hypothetical protein
METNTTFYVECKKLMESKKIIDVYVMGHQKNLDRESRIEGTIIEMGQDFITLQPYSQYSNNDHKEIIRIEAIASIYTC